MKLRTRPAALFTIAVLAAGCGSSGQAATTAATPTAATTTAAPTPTQMSGIFVALQGFGAPPVRAASARVRAWVHRNCGTSS